jgi:hypothetical protein
MQEMCEINNSHLAMVSTYNIIIHPFSWTYIISQFHSIYTLSTIGIYFLQRSWVQCQRIQKYLSDCRLVCHSLSTTNNNDPYDVRDRIWTSDQAIGRGYISVRNAAFLTRLTNTLEFMRTITSKASGGATAHRRRFKRLAFPTPSHKHHTSQW